MGFKILHLADLHLDVSFRDSTRSPALSKRRREDLRGALKNALNLAQQLGVDAVTIGGDLFESERITSDTQQFLLQQFAQLAPTRVFIAPGNHDAYTRASPYANLDWSSNVHIFREPRLTRVALTRDLDLWGAAHDSPAFYQSLLSNFRLPDAKPALLLLHGTDTRLTLGNHKSAFCPFTLQEVMQSGFTLALLGHIHQLIFSPEQKPLLCYPASPEPLGLDEINGHAVLLAEWDGRAWNVQPRAINQWECRAVDLDVSGLASRQQVVEQIGGMFRDERAAKKLLLRVTLRGAPQTTLALDAHAIRAGLGDTFADVVIEDETSPPFDLDALKQELTTTGVFVRRLLAELQNARDAGDSEMAERLARALRFGLMALEGKEIPAP